MRVSNHLDIYTNNVQLNNGHKYNKVTNPFFTGINEGKFEKIGKKTKITAASIGSSLLGFFGLKKLFKKPQKVIPVTPAEIKPVIESTVETIGKLIKKLKPANEELAQEFFPIFERMSKNLELKQEDYNTVLSGINNGNKKYIKEEGLNVIASQMENMKDLIATPAEDILTLINHLSKDNQDIFTRIINNRNSFRIEDIEDVTTYLKHITPENKDYVFEKLIPLLEKYSQKLKIRTADKHARLLRQITPEIQDIIPTIAESKALDNQRISKYQLLLNINKDNKDCVAPLLDNLESLGLKQDDLLNLLRGINNSQTAGIGSAGKNINMINELGLNLNDLLQVLKDENAVQIFDTIIRNPQGYKIQQLIDLKNYIRNLNPKNLEFIDKELLPKLTEHAEVLGIEYAEEMSEIMGKITPKTFDSIDIVAKYAEDLGDNISYPALLQAVTEENKHNLPRVLENIRNTEVWGNIMVSAEDFAKLLNTKG